MSRNTIRTATLADALVTRLRAEIRTRDLRLSSETDFCAWATELGAAPGITAVSQAFDPAYCDLSEAFWLRLHDGGQLLGTIAGKRLVGDFVALQRSGELWFGRRAGEFAPLALDIPDGVPDLRGNLGYFGALWLHPEVRGLGLAGPMARLVRAMAMRAWDLDWLCGGVLQDLALRGIPTRVYGYAHCVRISSEILFPVTGAPAVLYMPWESRGEWRASTDGYLQTQAGGRAEPAVRRA